MTKKITKSSKSSDGAVRRSYTLLNEEMYMGAVVRSVVVCWAKFERWGNRPPLEAEQIRERNVSSPRPPALSPYQHHLITLHCLE